MKKILAALLATAMTLSLAACGGGGGAASSGKAPAASNPAVSTPASSGDKIPVKVIAAEYGQNTKQWWADFVTEFNGANEGIDLTVEVVSWNDIYTVVNARIANNDAPDILNIDVFADYQADDLLLPAKDFVSEETYAKMYPAFLEQSNIDGTIWAIPDLASARAMYYNKDILDAAGAAVPVAAAQPQAAEQKPTLLVIIDGPLAGTSVPLNNGVITLGRASSNNVVLDDEFVSSHHARVYPDPTTDSWAIEDLHSTNGTVVNQQRINAPTILAPRVPVRIGATTFELR